MAGSTNDNTSSHEFSDDKSPLFDPFKGFSYASKDLGQRNSAVLQSHSLLLALQESNAQHSSEDSDQESSSEI